MSWKVEKLLNLERETNVWLHPVNRSLRQVRLNVRLLFYSHICSSRSTRSHRRSSHTEVLSCGLYVLSGHTRYPLPYVAEALRLAFSISGRHAWARAARLILKHEVYVTFG